MSRDDNNFLEVSFAFLLGSLVGATIALLYAPAPGDQTRRRIREATDEMQTNVKDQYGRLRDKAEIEVSRLKDRASESVDQARNYYQTQRSKVREAFQEGKRAYEDEQDKEELPTPSGDKS